MVRFKGFLEAILDEEKDELKRFAMASQASKIEKKSDWEKFLKG